MGRIAPILFSFFPLTARFRVRRGENVIPVTDLNRLRFPAWEQLCWRSKGKEEWPRRHCDNREMKVEFLLPFSSRWRGEQTVSFNPVGETTNKFIAYYNAHLLLIAKRVAKFPYSFHHPPILSIILSFFYERLFA